MLLRAYGDAYRAWHDVVLIIKTFPNPHNTVAQDLAALQAADPDGELPMGGLKSAVAGPWSQGAMGPTSDGTDSSSSSFWGALHSSQA